jgi:prepilin-type N-terminal cleavage/methylation domain-containing protein
MTLSKRAAGFTLTEVLVVLAVASMAITALIMVFPDLFARTRTVAVSFAAATLNQSSSAFLGAGGQFDPNGSAPDALLLLQTPVDAKSRQAGFGNFPVIDPRWSLKTFTSSGARLSYTFDAVQKRPIWAVQDAGAGYEITVDPTKTTPPTADWTDRVNRAGHVQARTSAWVWDYHDVGGGAATGSTATPTNYGNGTAPGGLSIAGPDTITTAGTYYWIGNSTQAGSLTITVGGNANQAVGVTQIQSPSVAFYPGDNTVVTVALTPAQGGSVTKQVTVNIPAGLSLSIAGPDTVTDTAPITWTATANGTATAMTVTVEGFPGKSGANTQTLTSDPASWPAGTNTTITVVATASSASGSTRATKAVAVQLVKDPDVQIVVSPQLQASVINTPGRYTFTLVSTNGVAGHMDLTATSSDGRTANGSLDNATQLPVSLDFTPADTDRLDGSVTLNGTLSTGAGAKSASLVVTVAIPRLKTPCQWTIMSQDGSPAALTVTVKQGADVLYQWSSPSAMASFTTPTVNLGAGSYTISGNGVLNGNDLTAADLTLTLSP